MAQITCARCGRTVEQMQDPPMRGKYGEAVHTQVCADCWSEWKGQQVMIINHYGLLPANPADREQLYLLMKEFLNLQVA
ncbi:MAG: Fe(2+)-trafficking protein [Armatimonadetes bacterium]|nr:Fe(2+)-trafficking protein [Armatimonadota bacterium]